MGSLSACVINLKGHLSSCRLSILLPENSYGKSDLTVGDLPPNIEVIILTTRSIWTDDKSKWYIHDGNLTTQYNKSIEYVYLTHETMMDILKPIGYSGLYNKGVFVLNQKKWFHEMLEFYNIISSEPLQETSVTSKISDTHETSKSEKTENKFSWEIETNGELIKVPDEARSVKISTVYLVYFLNSSGFREKLSKDDMNHIQSMDDQKPYIWVGLPENTVYIQCDSKLRYKFSHESKNIYLGVDDTDCILPKDYTLIHDGESIELTYSEDKKKHTPCIEEGVLIIGQS